MKRIKCYDTYTINDIIFGPLRYSNPINYGYKKTMKCNDAILLIGNMQHGSFFFYSEHYKIAKLKDCKTLLNRKCVLKYIRVSLLKQNCKINKVLSMI